MFYLYDKGRSQSITDAGTEIHLQMEKVFRAFGRKTKIERLYGKGHNSIGPHISFEELRLCGRRENTEAGTGRG
jgi:hypothetical protein